MSNWPGRSKCNRTSSFEMSENFGPISARYCLSDCQFEPNPMPIVYKIQKALTSSGIARHFRLALTSAEVFSLPPKTLQPDVSPQPFTRLPDFPISETFKSTAKQPSPNRQSANRSTFKGLQSGRRRRKSGHDRKDKRREQVHEEGEDGNSRVPHTVQTLSKSGYE